MQKFFTNTIEKNFIKSVLKYTPLPNLPTVIKGRYLLEGFSYVYKNKVIKCMKSGYLESEDSNTKAEIKVIESNYSFAKPQIMHTFSYTSKSKYYDSDTHRQLGDYLRYVRDVFNINLMGMYNCYTNKQLDNYKLDSNKGLVLDANADTELLLIPVKFNQVYTIALNCDVPFKYACMLYDDFVGQIQLSTISTNLNIKTVKSARFNEPFYINTGDEIDIVKFSTEDENKAKASYYYSNEYYLTLAIEVPKNLKTSVVVLEGKYRNYALNNWHRINVDKKTVEYLDLNHLNDIDLSNVDFCDNLFKSNWSLLSRNDGYIYAYSSKLIEYLLENVITSEEPFWQNIQRTQEYLKEVGTAFPQSTSGVWDNLTRLNAYIWYMNGSEYFDLPNTLKYDTTGFIDSSIEKQLIKSIELLKSK